MPAPVGPKPPSDRCPPTVDPVWEIALDQIEMQIKMLPPSSAREVPLWSRSVRNTIRDAEKAMEGNVTLGRARPTR